MSPTAKLARIPFSAALARANRTHRGLMSMFMSIEDE
jgi:hypothetical protein